MGTERTRAGRCVLCGDMECAEADKLSHICSSGETSAASKLVRPPRLTALRLGEGPANAKRLYGPAIASRGCCASTASAMALRGRSFGGRVLERPGYCG